MKLQGGVIGSALLLSGCSLFFTQPQPEPLSPPQETVLTLSIAANSNLSPTGSPQPVKVCVWQRTQPGFTPANALDGTPCQTNPATDAPFFSDIMSLGSQKRLLFTPRDNADYWLVIGAEFQQASRSRSLLEVRIPGKTGLALEVRTERQTLFLQSMNRN